MQLIVPTVHLNGTSGSVLEEQLCNVLVALRAALEFANEATPNARDYYVQGEGAFEAAQNQHTRRVEQLQAVRREYAEMLDNVVEQTDKR